MATKNMIVGALRDEDGLLLGFHWLNGIAADGPCQELGDESRTGGVLTIPIGGPLVRFNVRYRFPFLISDELGEGCGNLWVQRDGKSANRGVYNAKLSFSVRDVPVFGGDFKGLDCQDLSVVQRST